MVEVSDLDSLKFCSTHRSHFRFVPVVAVVVISAVIGCNSRKGKAITDGIEDVGRHSQEIQDMAKPNAQ